MKYVYLGRNGRKERRNQIEREDRPGKKYDQEGFI